MGWACKHRWASGLLWLGLPLAAAAQTGSLEVASRLPQNNEVGLLIRELETAVQREDYRLVVRLADQFFDLPASLVSRAGSQTYYPAIEQVNQLLERLPPAGVAIYRQLHDAAVAAALADAQQAHDPAALRALFERYRLSSHWPALGETLLGYELAVGNYVDVLRICQQLLAAAPSDPPLTFRLRLRQAVALAQVGAGNAANEVITQLSADPPPNVRDQQQLAAVADWLAARGSFTDGGATRPADLTPRLLWQRDLERDEREGYLEPAAVLADLARDLRRVPLQAGRQVDDVLLVRARDHLWALDAVTLLPRWDAASGPSAVGSVDALRGAGPIDEFRGRSQAVLHLFHDTLRHALAVDAERCYTLEAVEVPGEDHLTFNNPFGGRFGGWRRQQELRPPLRNELVARDISDGTITWRRGASVRDGLSDTMFLATPAVLDGFVYVPAWRENELRLLVFAADTGKLEVELLLMAGPLFPRIYGGEYALSADAGTLYVQTGAGLVAALERAALNSLAARTDREDPVVRSAAAWQWAYLYPQDPDLARQRGLSSLVESSPAKPLLVGDLLIVAPLDSRDLLAIDRFAGELRWRRSQQVGTRLVGATDQALLFADARISAVDPTDGQTILWRSVPIRLVGRPLVTAEEIVAPTDTGLVRIDPQTGKVIADQWPALQAGAPALPGAVNLVAGRDATFAVSPHQVVKLPAPAAAVAVTGVRAEFAQAMRAASAGDFATARTRLATLRTAAERSPIRAAARAQEIELLFAIADRAADEAEREAALTAAVALAETRVEQIRTRLRLATWLEQAARHADAWKSYQQVLLTAEPTLVPFETVRLQGVRAAWLTAERGLRRLLAAAAPDEVVPWTSQLAENAVGRPSAVRFRVAELLPAGPARDRLLVSLILDMYPSPAFPGPLDHAEIMAQYLPAGAVANLEPADQLKLALMRWELAVSVGDIPAADDAAEAWQTVAVANPAAATGSFERRARRIEEAHQKLTSATVPPLSNVLLRRWTVVDQALLPPDAQATSTGMGLTEALNERRVGLLNLFTGYERSQATSGLISEETSELAQMDEFRFLQGRIRLQQQLRRGRDDNELQRPVVTDGPRAAIAVAGGVLAYGLGPERLGGQMLWEAPIPAWNYARVDQALLAANADGVFAVAPPNTIMHFGWRRGALRWRATVPLEQVTSIQLWGERLVALGDYGRGCSLLARDGSDHQGLPDVADASPLGALVADNRLLTWNDRGFAAFAPGEPEPRWQVPLPRLRRVMAVQNAPLVLALAEQASGTDWSVLRVSDGAFLPRFKGDNLAIEQAVSDGERFYLVERGGDFIATHDLESGALLWREPFAAAAPFTASQFTGSRQYIPVLEWPMERRRQVSVKDLALRLLDKQTGQTASILDPQAGEAAAWPLRPYLKDASDNGRAAVYVMRNLVLVQAGDHLLALGSLASDR